MTINGAEMLWLKNKYRHDLVTFPRVTISVISDQ
jgi:hypothetical protein